MFWAKADLVGHTFHIYFKFTNENFQEKIFLNEKETILTMQILRIPTTKDAHYDSIFIYYESIFEIDFTIFNWFILMRFSKELIQQKGKWYRINQKSLNKLIYIFINIFFLLVFALDLGFKWIFSPI